MSSSGKMLWADLAEMEFMVRSEQVCIRFQREQILKADGIVGKITWDTTFAYQQDS